MKMAPFIFGAATEGVTLQKVSTCQGPKLTYLFAITVLNSSQGLRSRYG